MMGTQSEWVYSDLQSPKVTKAAHKIPLVSPRMDVDVTGVSLKNVRTHLIDHPRDDGLKRREQLWNFQQKYRGAIGKVRSAVTDGDDRKCETSGSDEQTEDDSRLTENSRPRAINDQSSLPSRFRKRLKHKINFTGLRTGDLLLDSGRRPLPLKEQKEDDKSNPGIQRLYSSGLIVKNNLYNQLRSVSGDEKKIDHFPDNSRILEAIHKYGSLEKLPDITYPGLKSAQTPNIRFLKTLHPYNRRIIGQESERRYLPLRRSLTNFNDLGSSKRKLIIVSRRGQNDNQLVRLGCFDTYNDDDDDDDDDDYENNDDVDDDEEDEEDYDDECDNENQVSHAEKLHGRDCDQKIPEHVAIRSNITQVNTQDDLVLIERHKQEEDCHRKELRTERTFHGDTRRTNICKEYRRTDLTSQDTFVPRCNSKGRENLKNSKGGSREKDEPKDITNKKRSQKKKTETDSKDECDSDDSLDIPEDRFGHTTHSIDKKLTIRKPWEWKPSPYRWVDKPYVKESDKPYIERIINNGEIIDEFHYDSFARTKPLKVQSFPEGAGYKDRYGNLR